VKLIKGVECAIKSMKKGEQCEVRIRADYNQEPIESLPTLTPNTALRAVIELVDFKPEKETWELNNFEEKLEYAVARRTGGNNFFTRGDLKLAKKKYKKALKVFEYDTALSEEEKTKAKQEVKLPCHLNMAQCYVKKENWKKAIDHATKALEIDANNIKGLWRRGVAYTSTGDFDQAHRDFSRALDVDPENKSVKASLAKLRHAEAEQDRKDKLRFRNVLSALSSDDQHTESATSTSK